MSMNNKYLNRLINEWKTHKRLIIGVDFDSTIYKFGDFDNSSDIHRVIAILLRAQRVGCYIVIHTSSAPERYDEIMEHCNSIGINVASINRNPIDLPYGNDEASKPFCNIYLDDRAGLNEALSMLEQALMVMWKI